MIIYINSTFLSLDWYKFNEFFVHKNFGGIKRQHTVAIFINKNYIGTDVEFQEYLTAKYNSITNLYTLNYKQLISNDIRNYYNNDKVNKI